MDDESRDVLRAIARVADDLGPALVPAGHLELLNSITEAAQRLFHAAACSLALLTDDQTELVFHVASGAGAEDVVGMRIPSSQGIAGWVVTSGQPIAIENVQSDARFRRDVAESTGYVPTSIFAMPLETERRMIGVISVLDREPGQEGSRDMELLALFARQAALAIENSRVFTELGKALFASVARGAEGEDVSTALQGVASDTTGASSELAELASHFNALALMGPEERAGATKLVGHFLDYVRSRRRW
jgi:GAF domain-containing protein